MTRQVKSRFGERGLAGTGMAHQGDVTDMFGVIRFHRKVPFPSSSVFFVRMMAQNVEKSPKKFILVVIFCILYYYSYKKATFFI